jgi:hypothetical protein
MSTHAARPGIISRKRSGGFGWNLAFCKALRIPRGVSPIPIRSIKRNPRQ